MVSSIRPLSDLAIHHLRHDWVDYPNKKSSPVSRDRELKWIKSALRDNTVVAISGGGGIGKSWLINSFLSSEISGGTKFVVYTAPSYAVRTLLLNDFFWTLITAIYPRKIPISMREKADSFHKLSNKEQVNLILDVISKENILIIIDNYDMKYCKDFNGLISSVQKKSIHGARILLSGRQIKHVTNAPHLVLEGLSGEQLAQFYAQQIEHGFISRTDVNAIWAKTWGIPLLNELIRNELFSRVNISSNQQILETLFYLEGIQDYLYNLFRGLDLRDRKVLKLLIRGSILNRMALFIFALFFFKATPSKAIEEYIARSIVYESNHGIVVPEITKEFIHYFE